MFPGPTASTSASSGDLLKMQILEFHPTESQILEVRPSNLYLISTPDDYDECSSLRTTSHRNLFHGNHMGSQTNRKVKKDQMKLIRNVLDVQTLECF